MIRYNGQYNPHDFGTLPLEDMELLGIDNIQASATYPQADLSIGSKPGKTIEHVRPEPLDSTHRQITKDAPLRTSSRT